MAEQKEVTLDDALSIVKTNMQQGNYRVAKMVLEDILKSQPDHHDSHYLIGLAFYFMGDVENAVIHLERATQAEDAEAEWWCNYGIMLNETNRLEDALKAYDNGIKTDKNFANSYWNKSHTLWLAHRFEEAEKAARDGIAIDPNIAESWLNLGTALVKLDRKEEAIEAWEKALEINPDFAFAWNNLGNVLREMGQLDLSAEKCRKALELDPSHAQSMNNLANALLDLGEIEEAED